MVPPGTSCIERRAIAATVPEWKGQMCSQCNLCSFLCPHAAIRPVLATPEELAGLNAPLGFATVQGRGGALKGLQYRMQVGDWVESKWEGVREKTKKHEMLV